MINPYSRDHDALGANGPHNPLGLYSNDMAEPVHVYFSTANVAVRLGNQPGSFSIHVINRPATLPDNFDFAKAVGLGMGLTLVSSLLPSQGAKLAIEQHGDAVESRLQLNHPCVSVPVTHLTSEG